MHALPIPDIRELDHRTNDGIDVRLMWNSATDRVFVTVEDAKLGDVFEVDVAPGEARAAFHHPFAYANRPVAALPLAA